MQKRQKNASYIFHLSCIEWQPNGKIKTKETELSQRENWIMVWTVFEIHFDPSVHRLVQPNTIEQQEKSTIKRSIMIIGLT